MRKIYVQLDDTNVVVGISELSGEVDSPHLIEVEEYDISLLGATYDLETGGFRHVVPSVDFSTLQQKKIEELDQACESAIMTGFQSKTTGYFYRFNRDDQLNFTQQMLLMIANPSNTEVVWKTEDAGPILHSKDEFLSVVSEAETHKRGCMQRYWELKSQAQSATTEEELNLITWEVTDETAAV